jgi:fumarate reductase subunit C
MNQSNMPLGSKDITILLVGICIMLVGFFVMTLDKEEFGFGFLGITLGPIVVLVGIIIPVFSLFKWKR